MDAPLSKDKKPVITKETLDNFEKWLSEEPDGDQVAAELDEMVQASQDDQVSGDQVYDNDLASDNDIVYDDDDDQAYPAGAMLTHGQMGGTWGVAPQFPPPAAIQQSVVQQPVAQQPVPGILSCPVHLCPWTDSTMRSADHLNDHLAANHGYDKAAREYSVDDQHLRRKKIIILIRLFIRDARKLAMNKGKILAVEETIHRIDPSYVSSHGLDLSLGLAMGNNSIPQANACRNKTPLINKLTAVRNEMSQKGRLYSQPGPAQSSWEEVYDDLISDFHFDQNAEAAVVQRAQQYFDNFRAAMGDDMADVVDHARVNRTHELVLKPNASLPPK